MAEERKRRRRGRRRGRGGGQSAGGPGEEGQRPRDEGQFGVEEESEAPGVLPSRLRFRFGRRGRREEKREGREEEDARGERREGHRQDAREGKSGAAAPRHVSPLSFWRRGRARTYREQPMPRRTLGRTWRRVRGLYFPPWVPVLFVIVVVSGILGVILFAGSAAGAPRINDHWHATYDVFVCGQEQPDFPTWGGGVHTHSDGVIHIHPFTPQEEGAGARLVKWFEYGGGKLSQSEMRMPGKRQEYKNGDTCPDGSEAMMQVFVNGVKLDDWSRYIPQDGDTVRIIFGPAQETEDVEAAAEPTVIPESEATRTVELEVAGGEADAGFAPDSIELSVGETVLLSIRNTGSISHIVRVAGEDGEYNTDDDFVSDPETILPGEEGALVVRFDEEGEFEFQDPSSPNASGVFVVVPAPEGGTPLPTPEGGDADLPEGTFAVTMGDSFFEPADLEVKAGEEFRILLTNDGELVHNLRIAGPDNEFETEDDLMSSPSPIRSGESGELVGRIDEPGVYDLRSDFQAGEMVGTITVE